MKLSKEVGSYGKLNVPEVFARWSRRIKELEDKVEELEVCKKRNKRLKNRLKNEGLG